MKNIFNSADKTAFNELKNAALASGFLSKAEAERIASKKCAFGYKKILMREYIKLKGFTACQED
jgi:hypothetical protein